MNRNVMRRAARVPLLRGHEPISERITANSNQPVGLDRSSDRAFEWSAWAFEQIIRDKCLLVQCKLDNKCIHASGTAIINSKAIYMSL